ncbi:hypothetical protein [Prosthecobacter sp.]|uniref:hypothetical protein n=1 Tax=Prosthecobacter sp. TaxID=1965333 RepID=UPI0024899173|nr:hypothetical protein [Prosthecobacter sp.]MDI1312581.1 hypothetical protein [Prosthecobacter sp.]
MKAFLSASVIAAMPREYYAQGALGSVSLGLFLYILSTVSIGLFVVVIMRKRTQPHRSFSPELVLTFIPVFCATAYLVLCIFRILEVSSRVQVSHAMLKNEMYYSLRPLGMALIASSLMLVLILLVRKAIIRQELRNETGDQAGFEHLS